MVPWWLLLLAFFVGSWCGFVMYAIIASGGHDDER